MKRQPKEVILIICFCLLCLFVQKVPAQNLNCYVTEPSDVSKVAAKDCGVHTGCLKRYDIKTQRTLKKECYMTDGRNNTCYVDPEDKTVGICWCHTDLCNNAYRWQAHTMILLVLRALVCLAFVTFFVPSIGVSCHDVVT
jgi:hypothetical protein